jgi:hypothetical protein
MNSGRALGGVKVTTPGASWWCPSCPDVEIRAESSTLSAAETGSALYALGP